MGQTNKTIEVNGKRYDSVTGAVITSNSPVKSAAAVHSGPHHAGPRSVDGFARVSRDHAAKSAARAATAKSAHHAVHTPAKHVKAHSPQRATTLMRSVVKKPAPAPKQSTGFNAHARTDIPAVRNAHPLTKKLSYDKVDRDRHARAHAVSKTSVVSHFGKIVSSGGPKHHTKHHASQGAAFGSGIPQGTPQGTPVTAPSNSTDIFEQALVSATSHKQTFENVGRPGNKRRKRSLAFASVSLAVLLLVGFVGYSSKPQISLTVASYRSGLHAKLPTYNPGDFAFSHLDYKPGNVTATFISTSGNEGYNISQRASNWDSQALLANIVSSDRSGYKTFQRAGRTVYIMSNNTATWVDSGILYTVAGNARLSSSQLLELASSM